MLIRISLFALIYFISAHPVAASVCTLAFQANSNAVCKTENGPLSLFINTDGTVYYESGGILREPPLSVIRTLTEKRRNESNLNVHRQAFLSNSRYTRLNAHSNAARLEYRNGSVWEVGPEGEFPIQMLADGTLVVFENRRIGNTFHTFQRYPEPSVLCPLLDTYNTDRQLMHFARNSTNLENCGRALKTRSPAAIKRRRKLVYPPPSLAAVRAEINHSGDKMPEDYIKMRYDAEVLLDEAVDTNDMGKIAEAQEKVKDYWMKNPQQGWLHASQFKSDFKHLVTEKITASVAKAIVAKELAPSTPKRRPLAVSRPRR